MTLLMDTFSIEQRITSVLQTQKKEEDEEIHTTLPVSETLIEVDFSGLDVVDCGSCDCATEDGRTASTSSPRCEPAPLI